jgi:hypothetical protein
MATILNRARDKDKSISEILREPNQFQAVTGTKNNPNPHANFLNAPDSKRLEQIFGAATNILSEVSREQRNFTAANPQAYGPGTNIGFRDRMIERGGSTVGGSVFNTAPPDLSNIRPRNESSQRDLETPERSSGGERVSNLPSPTRSGENGRLPDSSLVSIGEGRHRLHPAAAQAYMKMKEAAEADGIKWTVTDSYRTYEQQVKLAQEKGLYSQGGLAARPGTSNHGWGLAVDLGGGANRQGTKENEWLRQNAARFGFRTIAREPWHWEYTGGGEQSNQNTYSQSSGGRRNMETPIGAMGMPGGMGGFGGSIGAIGMGGMQPNPISAVLGGMGAMNMGGGLAGNIFGVLQNVLPPILNSLQQPEASEQRASLEQPVERASRQSNLTATPPTTAPLPPPRPPEFKLPTEETSRRSTESSTSAESTAESRTQQIAYQQNQNDPIDSASKLLEQISYNYGLGGKIPGVFV